MSVGTQEQSAEHASLTVHNFTSRASSQPSSLALLQHGQRIVAACTTSDGWHYPTPSPSGRSFGSRGRCYEYVRARPPPAPGVAHKQPREIRDWDSNTEEVDNDEIFALQDLEEFRSTEFTRDARPAESLPAESPKRKAATQTDVDPPRKRPRVCEQSLYRVLPQPHVCAAPDDAPSPRTTERRSLNKYLAANEPVPVPPYTRDTVREALEDPYARCAWVIPVRGTLPWPGCTAASVLDPDHASDEPFVGPRGPSTTSADDDGLSGQIVWTQRALLDFWDFLLQLREGGALGPIALSFHAAPSPREESVPVTSGTPAIVAGHAVETPLLDSDHASEWSSTLSHAAPAAPLLGTDHLKVYHDAQYAMRVRHVLYAWAFGAREPEKAEGVWAVAKVRVLKGARLALLDERAQAMLTM